MQHIEFIRAKAGKQLVALKREVKSSRRNKKTTINSDDEPTSSVIREIREDALIINGSMRNIRRIFITSADSGEYSKLGWVLSCDVDCCMVCLSALTTFTSKHHCRACGNVVCNSCSEDKATVLDILSVGPVRVCKQCYWGQINVDAWHNDHMGHVLETSQCVSFTPAEINEDVDRPDPRQYGQVKMMSVTPSFVIKTRRADRSVVFINICLCSEIPASPKDADCNMHCLVGGPVKELPVSSEEQTYLDKEGIHTHSIYDVAVNPEVVQEAMRDPTQAKRELLCEQVLEFIATKYPEGDFAVFQYVDGLQYVTEHNCPISSGNGLSKSLTTVTSSPSSDHRDQQHSNNVLDLLHAKMAIPSALCFRRLQQMVAHPLDCSDHPLNAVNETENQGTPLNVMEEFASMVHSIIKDTDSGRRSPLLSGSFVDYGKTSPTSVHEIAEQSPILVDTLGSIIDAGRVIHQEADGDDDSMLSETVAVESLAGVSHVGTLLTCDTKILSVGRKSKRFTIHGMLVSNDGKAMLTKEDMTTYIKYLTVPGEEAALLKQRSLDDAQCLIGWQVMLPSVFTESNSVVYVVTGVRKNSLRKTEYRLSSKGQDDVWIQLKRNDAKKTGEVFYPLRKVLYSHPSAKAVLNTINRQDKKRFSIFG